MFSGGPAFGSARFGGPPRAPAAFAPPTDRAEPAQAFFLGWGALLATTPLI